MNTENSLNTFLNRSRIYFTPHKETAQIAPIISQKLDGNHTLMAVMAPTAMEIKQKDMLLQALLKAKNF